MRTLNTLTQNLIANLTQLLQQPEEDALHALEVCAPVLIGQLQEVLNKAVDRRDIQGQLRAVLEEWLCEHPQPSAAQSALFDALRRHGLMMVRGEASV